MCACRLGLDRRREERSAWWADDTGSVDGWLRRGRPNSGFFYQGVLCCALVFKIRSSNCHQAHRFIKCIEIVPLSLRSIVTGNCDGRGTIRSGNNRHRPYQSASARFWHPEIHEVNCDGPSRPSILAEAIKRKCDVPFKTLSRARDIKRHPAHMNVFGSNAPNEPILSRSSFVRGIPLSGSSVLIIFA